MITADKPIWRRAAINGDGENTGSNSGSMISLIKRGYSKEFLWKEIFVMYDRSRYMYTVKKKTAMFRSKANK